MEYTKAKTIADQLVARLAPYCERIEIAGSLRRRKPEVHDIDLVCIPKTEPRRDMLGMECGRENLLTPQLMDLGRTEQGGERKRRIMLPQAIDLELWMVLPPAQWGWIYALRTGPADYTHWLVTPKPQGGGCPSYLKIHDGAVWYGHQLVPTPEEKTFFEVMKLEYVAPELRCPPTRVAVAAS